MRFLLQVVFLSLVSVLNVLAEDSCMDCHSHGDPNKRPGEVNRSVAPIKMLSSSVHADLSCSDCHEGIAPNEEGHAKSSPVGCANCHEDAAKEYDDTIHAHPKLAEKGQAARCKSCHGTHDILDKNNPQSRIYPANIVDTCGACHSKPNIRNLFGQRKADPAESYRDSVHGKAMSEHPDVMVANCVRCHGSHSIYPQVDSRSWINKLNLAKTCGQCHEAEMKEYLGSVHYRSVSLGHFDSPSCNDCHGEHHVIKTNDKEALTSQQLVSTKICAECHADSRTMTRHGLDAERFSSYMKTYHGLAVLKGSAKAASCVSCHEMHAIKDITDPDSPLSSGNRVATCSKCHKDVNERFAGVEVHPVGLEGRNQVAYIVKEIYIFLIVVLILGMLLHNGIIHLYFLRRKYKSDRLACLIRFSRFERTQHILLLVSFFTLVVSGFALKFPEASWVRLSYRLGFDEMTRSYTHYVAAIVLIVAGLIQMVYMILHRRGRNEVFSLVPKMKDAKDAWENLRFYLGLTELKPHFPRYDYTEKIEYLAVIWGTIIMAASGFVLWFPEIFIKHLPSWLFEVAEVVHYYEAWLATLSIIVWHWYFTIFHPEKYPLNTTFLHGRSPHQDENSDDTTT